MLMQGETVGKRLGLGGGALVFRRFGLHGFVQNSRIGTADDEELLAKTVALLGENGWELVSVTSELQPGASFSGARWVFKRPILGGEGQSTPVTVEPVAEVGSAEPSAGDSQPEVPEPDDHDAPTSQDAAPGTTTEEADEQGGTPDRLGAG
jgi:hypothetical protein